MDQLSQEVFDRLVQLDPEALTVDEVAFLNARRTYLNGEQRRIFASILVKEDKGNQGNEDPSQLSNKELCKLIEARGLPVPKQANKETLLKVLAEADELDKANQEA